MTHWPDGVPANLPAQDRTDIENLYARYAFGLDLADEELLLSTFAEDGVFDHLWQGQAKGHEAMLGNFRKLWYDRQHWWYGRQHIFNTFVMEPNAEGVRVRCFYQILQFNADYRTNFVFGIGTRDDQLVRRNGQWVYYKLFVNAWTDLDQVPWKGERTMMPRPNNQQPPADTRPFSKS